MATASGRAFAPTADVCMTFRGVGWEGFRHAKALVAEGPLRMTYAGGDLQIMSPGPAHEAFVETFSDLVKAVCRAFQIRARSLRSTLWERRGADAAKMPDAAFYIGNAARIGNRIPDVATDPVPDLAIEVEITNPITLALQSYARLGVAEVWHFARRPRRRALLRFLRLEGGLYVPSPTSLALPMLESAAVLPVVERAALLDDLDRAELFDVWIRDILGPGRRGRGERGRR